jgi:hypothetical protein
MIVTLYHLPYLPWPSNTNRNNPNCVMPIDNLRKVDCSSFVLCLLLVLPLPRAFLWQPLTVLTRQTRQVYESLIHLSFLDVYGHGAQGGQGKYSPVSLEH